jgi:hypothetical protein
MAGKMAKLNRETVGLKVFPLLSLMGWGLVGFSILVQAAVLAPTGMAYLGGNEKAARDAAAAGSSLIAQLTTLAFWPKLLLPLTFLGVAFFMVAIALEFAAIPRILDRRTEILERAVPLMGRR